MKDARDKGQHSKVVTIYVEVDQDLPNLESWRNLVLDLEQRLITKGVLMGEPAVIQRRENVEAAAVKNNTDERLLPESNGRSSYRYEKGGIPPEQDPLAKANALQQTLRKS